MSIHKIGSHSAGPSDPRGDRGSGSDEPEELQEAVPVRHSNGIDISPEGRHPAAWYGRGASEARLQQVRRRIRSGYYDKPSVAAELARRLRSNGIIEIVIP